MWKLREFRFEDAWLLCPTAIDEAYRRRFNREEEYEKWAKETVLSGPAYTALYKDKVIAAGGVHLLKDAENNSIGWVWVVLSPEARKYKLSTLRSISTMMWKLVEKYDLKRLITDSRKGFDASQRLLKHLGFTQLKAETGTHYYYSLECGEL